jgi:hypothetical protein
MSDPNRCRRDRCATTDSRLVVRRKTIVTTTKEPEDLGLKLRLKLNKRGTNKKIERYGVAVQVGLFGITT